MADLKLAFDILARDKASREIDKVGNALDRTGKKSAGFGRVVHAAMIGAASSVVGAAVASIKAAGDYEASLTSLVTGAGESQKNIKLVGDGMLSLAGKVGIGANDLAKGMYLIESSGKHGAEGLLVLKAAAEGARVGSADMATVADGLTTALNDYKIPATQAAKVTSQLVATVAAGKTHMADLAGALATVLPAASAAGVGLTQVLGAMATMTANGTPAADAATYLKQTIVQLANPTAKAALEMKSLGLNSVDISKNLGKRGLTGTLALLTDAIAKHMGPAGTVLIATLKKTAHSTTDFQKVLADLPPVQQTYIAALAKMVGGSKSMQAALELTGSNAATFNENVKTISTTTTEAGGHVKGFALTQKDFNTQLANVTASIHSLVIEVGDKLLPPLESFFTGMQTGTGIGGAFASSMKGIGEDARGAWAVAKPFFTFVGDHPTLFKEVAKDALLLAGAYKIMGAVRKLPSLSGLGGKLGGSLGAEAASLAKPVPVFVTNEGFGAGGGLPGVPGTKGKPGVGDEFKKAGKLGAVGAAVAGQAVLLADIVLTPKAISSLHREFGFSYDLSVNDAAKKFLAKLNNPSTDKVTRGIYQKHFAAVFAGVAEASRTGNTKVLQHALLETYADVSRSGAAIKAQVLRDTAASTAATVNLISGGLLSVKDLSGSTGKSVSTNLSSGFIHGVQTAQSRLGDLRGSILGIPSVKPTVTLAGAPQAYAWATQIGASLNALNGKKVTASVLVKTLLSNPGHISGVQTVGNTHAAGGFISGPGSSTSDSIPSWLSNGEYVINARAARGKRAMLDAINLGRMPTLATASARSGDTYNVTVNNPVPEPARNLPRALSHMTFLLSSA